MVSLLLDLNVFLTKPQIMVLPVVITESALMRLFSSSGRNSRIPGISSFLALGCCHSAQRFKNLINVLSYSGVKLSLDKKDRDKSVLNSIGNQCFEHPCAF